MSEASDLFKVTRLVGGGQAQQQMVSPEPTLSAAQPLTPSHAFAHFSAIILPSCECSRFTHSGRKENVLSTTKPIMA